jgi:hypothetical protein
MPVVTTLVAWRSFSKELAMKVYRTLGVLGILFALAASASASPVIYQPSLIGYYSFDNAANLGADTSGRNYNGTVSNTTGVTAEAVGKFGGALRLANVVSVASSVAQATDYIQLPSLTGADAATNKFTFAAWINFEDTVYHKEVFSALTTKNPPVDPPNDKFAVVQVEIRADRDHTYEPPAVSTAYRLRLVDNTIGTVDPPTSGLNTLVDSGTGAMPVADYPQGNVWQHIAMTFDGTLASDNAKVYVNGTLVRSANTSSGNSGIMSPWLNGAVIGRVADSFQRGYAGQIDEMYLLKTALDADQIAALVTDAQYIALPGDANGADGVNVADLTNLLNNYNKSGMVWANGDFNADGAVNVADLTLLLNNYNKSFAGSVAAGTSLSAATNVVPEPSSLVLLAILSALLGAWVIRRRSSC